MAQTFETSSIAASASSAPGAGAAVALLEEEAEQALLAVQLDDVPGKLVRLVDLGRPRRDPLRARACARARAARAGRQRAAARRRIRRSRPAGRVGRARNEALRLSVYHTSGVDASSAAWRRPPASRIAALISRRGRPSSSIPRASSARSSRRELRRQCVGDPGFALGAELGQRGPPERGEVEQHLAPVAGVGAAR